MEEEVKKVKEDVSEVTGGSLASNLQPSKDDSRDHGSGEQEASKQQDGEHSEQSVTEESSEPTGRVLTEEEIRERKRKRAALRWEKMLEERARAKAEAEFYKKQLEVILGAQPNAASGKPMRENYSTEEEYIEALTEWKLNNKISELEKNMQEKYLSQQVQNEWAKRVVEAKAKYPDFDEVVMSLSDVPNNNGMVEAIKQSPLGGDIMYFLGQNPDIAANIASLSPFAAAKEIGKIETKIMEKKQQQPKPQKHVPPVTPPSSGGGAYQKALGELDDVREYMKRRGYL